MKDDTTITRLRQPGTILDPLTEIVREGACRLLAAALGAEAAGFAADVTDARLPDGRQRGVHHGTGPGRTIQTGTGPIPVERQKARDRAADVPAERKVRFTSTILPRRPRRSRSLDALLPVPYLCGLSTGDIQVVLTALPGADAPNLSPGAISRLTAGWQAANSVGPVRRRRNRRGVDLPARGGRTGGARAGVAVELETAEALAV
jgi:hypothetical protein